MNQKEKKRTRNYKPERENRKRSKINRMRKKENIAT